MKINPTIRLLSLALCALEETVFPEVKSEQGKENVGLIRTILTELFKREEAELLLLRKTIADGEALYIEISQILNSHSNGYIAEKSSLTGSNFPSLAERHNTLTQRLSNLCVQLSLSKKSDARAASLLRKAAEWELAYFNDLQNVEVDSVKTTSLLTNGQGPDFPADPAPSKISAEFLEKFLNTRRGPVRVTAFSSIPGGYSNQTYFSTLEYDDGRTEEIVIRKSVPTVLAPFLDLDQEFVLLADLYEAGFPCPRPLDLALHPEGIDDTFFTMARLPGCPPGTYFHADKPISETLLLRLAEMLAQLHNIPLEALSGFISHCRDPAILQDTVQDCYRRHLEVMRMYVERVDHLPSPYITWLFDWLERNIPGDVRRPVLVHGDFNVHNVLATEDDHVTGIIDWETADIGAPELDLAYFKSHVSRYMDWDRWLSHYHASGGLAVDSHNMAFCQAYSMLRMMLAVSRKVLDLQLGLSSDIRYTLIQFAFVPGLMQMGLDCTNQRSSEL